MLNFVRYTFILTTDLTLEKSNKLSHSSFQLRKLRRNKSNSRVRYFLFHSLTLARVDKIGIKTVELIMSYFNGEEVAEEVLIPTELYRQEDGLKDSSLQ